MTLELAKKLYIEAGGYSGHLTGEWKDIHKEMESLISAKSDRAAGRLIDWWGCWDKGYTATAFARRIRRSYAYHSGQSSS